MKTWTTKSGQNIVRLLHGRCNCYLLVNAIYNFSKSDN